MFACGTSQNSNKIHPCPGSNGDRLNGLLIIESSASFGQLLATICSFSSVVQKHKNVNDCKNRSFYIIFLSVEHLEKQNKILLCYNKKFMRHHIMRTIAHTHTHTHTHTHMQSSY